MPLTLTDLIEKLKREDEVTLMDMLGLTSEDLLDRFGDVLEEKYDQIISDYENEDTDSEEF